MKKQTQEYAIVDLGDDDLMALETNEYDADDFGTVLGYIDLDVTGTWTPGSQQDLALSLRDIALEKWEGQNQ